jgi:hypothetical protein
MFAERSSADGMFVGFSPQTCRSLASGPQERGGPTGTTIGRSESGVVTPSRYPCNAGHRTAAHRREGAEATACPPRETELKRQPAHEGLLPTRQQDPSHPATDRITTSKPQNLGRFAWRACLHGKIAAVAGCSQYWQQYWGQLAYAEIFPTPAKADAPLDAGLSSIPWETP